MIARIRRFLIIRRKAAQPAFTIESLQCDVVRLHSAKLAAEKRAREAEAKLRAKLTRIMAMETPGAAHAAKKMAAVARGDA